jgi:hypothetical protein
LIILHLQFNGGEWGIRYCRKCHLIGSRGLEAK